MVFDHGTIFALETIAISKFKATCLAVLERVRVTGEPILVSWTDAQTMFHEFGHALHGLSSPESRSS